MVLNPEGHTYTAIGLAIVAAFAIAMYYVPGAVTVLLGFVLVAGPLSVVAYAVGLGFGPLTGDGLPALAVGGLFTVLWLCCAVVQVTPAVSPGTQRVAMWLLVVVDIFALGAGLVAIDHGWPGEDRTEMVERRQRFPRR